MARFTDFIRGYGLGQQMVEDYERARERDQLAEIAKAQPQQSQGFTAEQGQQLDQLAGTHDIAYNADQQAYVATPRAGGETSVIAQQGVTDFLGARTAGTLDAGQVRGARIAAMSGVLGARDPAAGMRLEALGQDLADRDRKRAGDASLQAILGGARPASMGSRTDLGDAPAQPAASAAGRGAAQALLGSGEFSVTKAIEQQNADTDLDNYLQRVVPSAIQELVQQGRLDEARQFQEFAQSREGQRYAQRWTGGIRKLAFGDHAGAVSAFEGLYNDTLGGGQRIKLTPDKDGKSYAAELFDVDGNSLGAQTMPIDRLAATAAAWLSPERAVAHYAAQTSQRDKEGALLNRQIELEGLRQQGRDALEDRRDARLTRQLSAQEDRLARRLAGSGGGAKLSPAQERSNLEIDAARKRVARMSPDEIRRRTAPTTATGRENPDYDPSLARAAALARRRKIGDDDEFDLELDADLPQSAPAGVGSRNADGSFTGTVPRRSNTAPTALRQDRLERFKADPQMRSYRLGRDTAQGVEVLDRAGRVVGHFD